jgi:hypothetical protein
MAMFNRSVCPVFIPPRAVFGRAVRMRMLVSGLWRWAHALTKYVTPDAGSF